MVDISKYCFNHQMIEFIMHKILDDFYLNKEGHTRSRYKFNFFFKGNWSHLFILNY